MAKPPGYPVVLTADRTLTAGYRLLFDGMLAASQTSTNPPALLGPILMPPGRSLVAPFGLRRIEAALLEGGFTPDEVIFVDGDHLRDAIGPATRVIGVTSGEPVGGGMNSSTMTGIAGGRIYPEVMFRRLMKDIRRRIASSAPSAKVVLGGPGAWQVADNSESRRMLGIDHVVTGYAEGNAAEVFRSIINGVELPEVICGQPVSAAEIPRIRRASTMGVVEISRGCGLGCGFCTINRVPMIHLPVETISADVRTNVSAGMTSVALLSEDFFRYGGESLRANPAAVISLLTEIRKVEGVRLIQIDHVNVSSISQYSDEELDTVRALLVGKTGCNYPWVNVGIETASGELLRSNGGGPKMARVPTGDWGDFCAEQLRRLSRAGFLPMASLVIGLSGETEEDVRRTSDWVESLSDLPITVFPMLLAPIDGTSGLRPNDLTKLHWQMIRSCYRLNFKWTPRMYWDNQRAVGVPAAKRVLLQAMGRGQVLQWNAFFALRSRSKK